MTTKEKIELAKKLVWAIETQFENHPKCDTITFEDFNYCLTIANKIIEDNKKIVVFSYCYFNPAAQDDDDYDESGNQIKT